MWLPKPSGRIVVGDAVHFYVYLRSVVFDGDVRFQNEYARLYNVQPTSGSGFDWVFTPLPTGHVRNLMPIGPAIVWAPLYLLVTLVVAALRLVGVDYPLDGYGRLFQATAGFTGIAAATGGVFLAYRAANAAVQRALRHLVDPGDVVWLERFVLLGHLADVLARTVDAGHRPARLALAPDATPRRTSGATLSSAAWQALPRSSDGRTPRGCSCRPSRR